MNKRLRSYREGQRIYAKRVLSSEISILVRKIESLKQEKDAWKKDAEMLAETLEELHPEYCKLKKIIMRHHNSLMSKENK